MWKLIPLTYRTLKVEHSVTLSTTQKHIYLFSFIHYICIRMLISRKTHSGISEMKNESTRVWEKDPVWIWEILERFRYEWCTLLWHVTELYSSQFILLARYEDNGVWCWCLEHQKWAAVCAMMRTDVNHLDFVRKWNVNAPCVCNFQMTKFSS